MVPISCTIDSWLWDNISDQFYTIQAKRNDYLFFQPGKCDKNDDVEKCVRQDTTMVLWWGARSSQVSAERECWQC